MTHYVLILGGGQGTRLNNITPKQFLELNGIPIIMHSAYAFLESDPECKIYIGLPTDYISEWYILTQKYNFNINHEVFEGGQKRLETVYLGIKRIMQENKCGLDDIISIHDGARPFIDSCFISDLISEAKIYGSAVPVLSLKNALIRYKMNSSLSNTKTINSINRRHYKTTQTPQIFKFDVIEKSYKNLYDLISKEGNNASILSSIFDDASVYENFKPPKGPRIHAVPGREYNIKITTPMDYYMAPYIFDFYKSMK